MLNIIYTMLYLLFLFGSLFSLEDRKRLILIGLDGFSYNYWSKIENKYALPNFKHFINDGVFSRVQNIYQTKTFPSLISIVTGLYSENHGIYGSHFYDSNKNIEYNYNITLDAFNGAYLTSIQPIWSLVENGPINCTMPFRPNDKSIVFEWLSGTKLRDNDIPKHGYPASYYQTYIGGSSFSEKLEKLIKMMQENENITLGVLYHDQPDYNGHEYGPYTEEVYEKIVSIDKVKGNHGYGPENKEMNPIFIGYGGYFRKSFKPDKPIRQIDIYELMCNILGITPDKNDGDLKYIIHNNAQLIMT
ncbi:hypothetical protein A3Q56_05536 [Intoshia linei]|uniref:Uncharacterized protein n=1 Tax=Intoshia linei TaxID=1819745 RepID=A0A177AXI3_9BILA|nr:hypothetical protein A3Q56_05536 [Intoshia linei]